MSYLNDGGPAFPVPQDMPHPQGGQVNKELLAACKAALAGFAGVESGLGKPGMLKDLTCIKVIEAAIASAEGGAS